MLAIDPATATNHRRYPSISLLVPIAGSAPWKARLAGLRRQAEQRLRMEFGDRVDAQLLDRLRDAVDTATLPPGTRSLAVFVNDTSASIMAIDVDVRERTVIDDTFATRDLVAGDLRSPRYWVLALNLEEPRLLRGRGRRLDPVALALAEPVEPSSGRDNRRGRDRTDVIEARRTRRLRALDQALRAPLGSNSDPLVVVGAEPTSSRFVGQTRHIDRVEGVVRRAPDRDLAALAGVVAPSVDDVLAERRALALAALERAIRAGNATIGLERVWRAAHRGPGLLLVEQAYEQPVRLAMGGAIRRADDRAAPGVIDDAVDEIIEAVLARGGRVELVPGGILTGRQHIAFVPTQRRKR